MSLSKIKIRFSDGIFELDPRIQNFTQKLDGVDDDFVVDFVLFESSHFLHLHDFLNAYDYDREQIQRKMDFRQQVLTNKISDHLDARTFLVFSRFQKDPSHVEKDELKDEKDQNELNIRFLAACLELGNYLYIYEYTNVCRVALACLTQFDKKRDLGVLGELGYQSERQKFIKGAVNKNLDLLKLSIAYKYKNNNE